jgi:hypothetical protein
VPLDRRAPKPRPDKCGERASTRTRKWPWNASASTWSKLTNYDRPIIPRDVVGLIVRKLRSAVAQSVAVFDFELIDTSLEGAIRGTRADEQERLASLSNQLRQQLRNSGRFSLVDITPIAREAQASNLQACGGCDMRLAQRIGAELAITGTVQKVSNLILNMNIYVRDASTGATIAAMSADMRGNTDETWSRTLDWLVHNRLLAPGYGLQR